MLDRMSAVVLGNRDRTVGRAKPPAPRFDVAQMLRGVPAVRLSALRFRAVGRAKPPARHFDVAQALRGVPAVRLSAGNGASFSALRQRTRVRLLPALRLGSGGTCSLRTAPCAPGGLSSVLRREAAPGGTIFYTSLELLRFTDLRCTLDPSPELSMTPASYGAGIWLKPMQSHFSMLSQPATASIQFTRNIKGMKELTLLRVRKFRR